MNRKSGSSYLDEDYDWNSLLDEADLADIFQDEQKTELAPIGNSFRPASKSVTHSVSDVVDEHFRKKIKISENGTVKRITTFEAIVMQLLAKAISGESRALHALALYSKLGNPKPESKRRLIVEHIMKDGRYIQDFGER